jgi:glycosyltransferase involved in cell wall biosynthesis
VVHLRANFGFGASDFGFIHMRILLLAQSYAPRMGGLETVVQALARQLSADGHRVSILTNRYPRSLPDYEVINDIPVHREVFLTPRMRHLQDRRFDVWFASLAYRSAIRARMKKIFQEFRPHVVNFHFPDHMIPFVRMMRKRYSFRLVVSVHGNDVMRFSQVGNTMGYEYGPGNLRALSTLFRDAEAITACSPFLLSVASQLEPAVKERGVAIYNGIDPARFADRTKYQHPRPYVLGFGRFVPKKGFDLLVEAFGRVAAEYPELDLILAGEGRERPALEAIVDRMGIESRVHFYGRANPVEVVQLLNGCRFMSVPSRIELFGIAALEGLAAQKPVLATRGTGMEGFLKEMLALLDAPHTVEVASQPPIVLVEPTVEAMLEGLRVCMQARWCGAAQERIATTILRDFSWAKVAQRYEAVLTGQRVPAQAS